MRQTQIIQHPQVGLMLGQPQQIGLCKMTHNFIVNGLLFVIGADRVGKDARAPGTGTWPDLRL
jgi:hypothetical protein